ncbi:MAG: hypothetical protein K8I30_02855 [Anaerolineae bacterium]|nr:hypothetical protein [Anaerolineae bacterium]
MSTSFFLAPIDPNFWFNEAKAGQKPVCDLRIDPDWYHAELLKKWPLAKVYSGGSEHYVLSWNLDTEEGAGPEGGLQADCQHVSFRYSTPTFEAFIRWHRGLIPEKYALYLFNSSSAPTHLVITASTTSDEIENYLMNS